MKKDGWTIHIRLPSADMEDLLALARSFMQPRAAYLAIARRSVEWLTRQREQGLTMHKSGLSEYTVSKTGAKMTNYCVSFTASAHDTRQIMSVGHAVVTGRDIETSKPVNLVLAAIATGGLLAKLALKGYCVSPVVSDGPTTHWHITVPEE